MSHLYYAAATQLSGFGKPMFISETSTDDRNGNVSTLGGNNVSLQKKAAVRYN
jgi:hypothetical protein